MTAAFSQVGQIGQHPRLGPRPPERIMSRLHQTGAPGEAYERDDSKADDDAHQHAGSLILTNRHRYDPPMILLPRSKKP